MATILEFAGVHYFTKVFTTNRHDHQDKHLKVGSGERFGSDGDEPLDAAAFSDEEEGDQDNDGDDEWEDVEVSPEEVI